MNFQTFKREHMRVTLTDDLDIVTFQEETVSHIQFDISRYLHKYYSEYTREYLLQSGEQEAVIMKVSLAIRDTLPIYVKWII